MSAFIISLPALERNALILRDVADAAGCRIALALKGVSCWPCFEALSPWLDGGRRGWPGAGSGSMC